MSGARSMDSPKVLSLRFEPFDGVPACLELRAESAPETLFKDWSVVPAVSSPSSRSMPPSFVMVS